MSLERLANVLADPSLPGISITELTVPADAREAAVLLLLTDDASLRVTLIERAATLAKHAGQVACPGGGVDPGETAVQAALRETEEEIGLPKEQVRVLGTLRRTWVPVSGYAVTPVVASWKGEWPVRPVHTAEVSAVHQVALATLADPSVRCSSRHPSGYIGPAFVVGELFIWGLTAHLLSWILDLGDWSRPWDESRFLDVPDRFQRDRKPPI